MKIAILTYDLKLNGVSQFVISLTRSLIHCEHQVAIITTNRSSEDSMRSGSSQSFVDISDWSRIRLLKVVRLARYLKREKFDVVISNVGWLNAVGQLSLRLLPRAIARLVVLHNHSEKVYQTARISTGAWRSVVVVSPLIERNVKNKFPDALPFLIPYGVCCPDDLELAQRNSILSPLRLLYVGRLIDEQKGIFLIPSILSECKKRGLSPLLTIVGEGADQQQLEALLKLEGVEDLVTFVGGISREMVYSLMQLHHALIMPSYYEGFPLVVLEAQANGCVPIVSSLVDVTTLSISHGISGFLVAGREASAFAQYIQSLAESDTWSKLSRAGIARARSLYSDSLMAQRYSDLLAQLTLARERGHYLTWIDYFSFLKDLRWYDFIPDALIIKLRNMRRLL